MVKKSSVLLMALMAINAQAATGNLLSNPGFESGLDSWQHWGNAAIRVASPAPYEGSKYLFGERTASFSVWQDIDILAAGLAAAEIDAGRYTADFGGFQAGWNTQTDYGRISLHFYDDQLAEIGSSSLPGFYSNNTWVEQAGAAAVLAGTRTIRYQFVGTRVEGLNDDAYLDAAYLTVAAVPEPESYALMLAGLAVVGVMARKRSARTA